MGSANTSSRSERRAIQEHQRAAKIQNSIGPEATKILLIRHGETDWNKTHRLQGQRDPPLNDQGRLQAKVLAARLKTEVVHAIYSSDLLRASATAEAIALAGEPVGTPLQAVTHEPAFRERSIGVLEGLTPAEARIAEPEAWRILVSEEEVERVPGGELVSEVEARASEAVDQIVEEHPGQTVVVVTHGGVLQVLYRHASGQDYYGKFRNCAINTLWVWRGRWLLGVWGDTAHLQSTDVQQEAFGGGTAG